MRQFVSRRNIDRYRELLRCELNDERRRTLRALLAEEESKLAAMEEPEDHADGAPEASSDGEHGRDACKPD
jgi:hypothetical protein